MIRCRMIAAAFLICCAGGAAAQSPEPPRFARIFADHGVLQRDRPIAIWGWAAAGARVDVALGERHAWVRAGHDGRWRVVLPKLAAGGPYTLSATAGGATTMLADMLIGDVYLCGGQSNMEFPAGFATGAWSGLAGETVPDLRFVTIPKASEAAPRDDLKQPVAWRAIGPDTVAQASAVCYFMARDLHDRLKVPVGFIADDWGGTRIEGWLSAPALRTLPGFAEPVDRIARLAADPAAANADEGGRQDAWWHAHDPDADTQRGWSAAGYDDSGWSELPAPGPWKRAGVPALAAFDGVVWWRHAVTLTAAQAAAADALQLGPIDTYDTTWVNGERVGSGTTAWVWRDYPVRRGLFHAGRNIVAMRVLGGAAGGGATGPSSSRAIALADGSRIMLDGTWRYHMGLRASGLAVPAAPWDVPNSLVTLYNGMIAPIAGYGLKLVAWYQGESNAGAPAGYAALLSTMMRDWRARWGQEDLPFVVAQLSAYGVPATEPGASGWARLRAEQARAVRDDPHAALAVTLDVGDRYDIHPPQKRIVGERLARAVRAVAYGEPITPGGPEAVTARRDGADLVVAFRHVATALRTYGAAEVIGLEVCTGETCRYARGVAQGTQIRLPDANRPGATHVRYAWSDAPLVNLFDTDDLPAAPFDIVITG